MKHAFLIIAHNEYPVLERYYFPCWTMNVMTFICILTNGLQNCFSK